MQCGISVTKFNYNNRKSKELTLQLSACRTKLTYLCEQNTIWGKIKGYKSIGLRKITDIVYGGATKNFRQHLEGLQSIDRQDGQEFYAWDCVSLVKPCGATFDLVIRDAEHLFALIHLVHRNIHKTPKPLHSYKRMKLQMKIQWSMLERKCTMAQIFKDAIYRTINER